MQLDITTLVLSYTGSMIGLLAITFIGRMHDTIVYHDMQKLVTCSFIPVINTFLFALLSTAVIIRFMVIPPINYISEKIADTFDKILEK